MVSFKEREKANQAASFARATQILATSLKAALKATPLKPAPLAFFIKSAFRATFILLQEILLYAFFSFSLSVKRAILTVISNRKVSASNRKYTSPVYRSHRTLSTGKTSAFKLLVLTILFAMTLGWSMQTVLAFESHLIDIRAHVENALGINTYSVEFGTVFPEETIDRHVVVGLSQSFREQERDSTVEYSIYWAPKPIEGSAADPDNDGYFEPIWPYIELKCDDVEYPQDNYVDMGNSLILVGDNTLSLDENECDTWYLTLDPPVFDKWYNELTDPKTPSGVLAGDQYYTEEETAACGFTAQVPHADLGSNLIIQVTSINGSDDGNITGIGNGTENNHTPVILCKWEQQNPASVNESGQGYGNLETGDTEHLTNGTQILPALGQTDQTHLQYWAIITDPYGVEKVTEAVVDIYYPSALPYNGSIKYRLNLEKVSLAEGLAAYEAARDANLVTYQSNWVTEEGQINPIDDAPILDAINDGNCAVWMVTGSLDSTDPAGDYRAVFDAVDNNGSWASQKSPTTNLTNTFTYIAVAGIEVDFNYFNYGEVQGDEQNLSWWVLGDTYMDNPIDSSPTPNKATVMNIGNVPVYITITNNDMGLGSNGEQDTQYSGPVLPNGEQSNWNVVYGARLSSSPGNVVYYDPNVTGVILKPLGLAQIDGLDLYILLKQAASGEYNGNMTIGYVPAPWN